MDKFMINGKINLPKRLEEFEKFQNFKNKAIDFEEGEGFFKNIKTKGTQFFFSEYSFCIFKIVKVEDVNTCYVHYMYSHDEKSFRSCYYAMINYCLGNNVKFIFYSEKEKNPFYKKFLKEKGFKNEKTKKKYSQDYKCKKCGGNYETCTCETLNFYI